MPLVSPTRRHLRPPEEREKSAASSALKRMSGTSLNVLHGVRLVACVDVKEQVCAVEKPDHKGKLLAVMLLNGHRVPFQLDTGATVSILPEESFKEVYGEYSLSLLDNVEATLVMYNKTEEKPIGMKRVQGLNPRNGRKYSVEFVVVKGKGKPLLGLRASEQMQLISVVSEVKSRFLDLLPSRNYRSVYQKVFSREICSHTHDRTTLISRLICKLLF